MFNEERNLIELHTRLAMVLNGMDYEVIFVDDGSHDNSPQFLKNIADSDNHVKVIQLTRNFGQHPAVMAGFEHSSGDIVITLDADLQNPPEEIPKLLTKINEGYEVVFGVFLNRKHTAFRRIGSQFTKWVLSHIVPVEMTGLSGFRAIQRHVVEELKQFHEKGKFIDGIFCWMGYRVGTVEVVHCERYSGKTKYTPFKLIGLWMDIVVSLTDLPLKIATFGGIFLGIVGFVLAAIYALGYLIYGFSVSGFATIVILITFFSGVQLFSLGILGEYIGRMSKDIKNKPEYIIRQ